jgi:hypothetical protein
MRIVYEKSGTHVHKDQLKARLDFYPEIGEKSYTQNYVNVPVIPEKGYPGKVDKDGNPANQKDYDTWLAGLPHIWQLNPCLSVFVAVDQNITKQVLTEFCNDIYKADQLATIDDIMSRTGLHESAHLISPYMNGKNKFRSQLSTAKTLSFDTQAKTSIDNILKDFTVGKLADGKIEQIQPQSIDVGPGAFVYDASAGSSSQYTWTVADNPANADGTLNTWELYFWDFNAANVVVATNEEVSADTFTTRDYETIGAVTCGSKQVFTGLSTSVATGDYAGVWWSNEAGIAMDYTTGYAGVWIGTDVLPLTNSLQAISTPSEGGAWITIAIYATGTEAGGTVQALAGVCAGAGGMSGLLANKYKVTATMTGAGSAIGLLSVKRTFSGVMNGSGTLAGNLKNRRSFSGVFSGVGLLSAELKRIRQFTGTMTASGVLAGILNVVRGLKGSISGSGSMIGALSVKRNLTAIFSGSGQMVGDLTLKTKVILLSAVLSGVGSFTGILTRIRNLTGTMTGTGTLSANLRDASESGSFGSGILWWFYKRIHRR